MSDLWGYQPPKIEAGAMVRGSRKDAGEVFLKFSGPDGEAVVLTLNRTRAIELARDLCSALRETSPRRAA